MLNRPQIVCLGSLVAVCWGCGGEATYRKAPPSGAAKSSGELLNNQIRAVERGESDSVTLIGAAIDDADLRRLGKLRGLKQIDLGPGKHDITDSGVKSLRNLTQLEVLVLGEAPISDASLDTITQLNKLRRLNFTGARITNAGLGRLQSLRDLEMLRIGGRAIDDAGAQRLVGMQSLRSLIIVQTPITDAAIPYFRRMKNLESLYLLGTRVSDEGIEELNEFVHAHD